MVYEAARIAVENNLPPVCGPFDFAQTRIAFVLWVFYLSKVRAWVGKLAQMTCLGVWRSSWGCHRTDQPKPSTS